MRDGIDSGEDLIAAPRGRGEWLMRHGKWLIILPPMLYLLVFFLIPFAFALKISFADTAVRVPPSPTFYPSVPTGTSI